MIDSQLDLSQKLLSYMHEFYSSGLEEKCNEANSKIQESEIENNQVKKLNNLLQAENAGYIFNILLVTFLQHNLHAHF